MSMQSQVSQSAQKSQQFQGTHQNQQALSTAGTPCINGFFGKFGGQFVPEELRPLLLEITECFENSRNDPAFIEELNMLLKTYSGRPTPLFYAKNLTQQLGGAKIYLKREDLNHLGAHKLNNTLGQMLIAKRMGKKRVIAETGAGQHGVATAATAALMGMQCVVYMGKEDMVRQELNVFRMRMMGAEVIAVTQGQAGLKEAVDQALQDWVKNKDDTFYIIGSAVGPHPFPLMVRTFQSVISKESREQMLAEENRLPDYSIACVGGGSNAIGMFAEFLKDASVKLVGVEPGGKSSKLGDHAATLCFGKPGILHGSNSYFLQDEKGDVAPVHSVSAGLDYPGIGPEHSYLKESNRAQYVAVSDQQALDAFFMLSRSEGIIPALESSHALAYACQLAPTLNKDAIILVCLSGRGDKDIDQVRRMVEK